MVPAETDHATGTATLSPASVRPEAVNCWFCDGTRVMAAGETTTFTTCVPGCGGLETLTPGCSHAASAAVERIRATGRIRARRWDSLKVNVICCAPATVMDKKNRQLRPSVDSLAARRT